MRLSTIPWVLTGLLAVGCTGGDGESTSGAQPDANDGSSVAETNDADADDTADAIPVIELPLPSESEVDAMDQAASEAAAVITEENADQTLDDLEAILQLESGDQ